MSVSGPGIHKRGEIVFIDPKYLDIEEGWNPRKNMKLDLIIPSIKAHGVKRPIQVVKKGERFVVRSGHRRTLAVKTLNEQGCEIKSVPATIVSSKLSEIEQFIETILENQNENLEPLEEAEAFQRFVNWGWTQVEIADKLGYSQSYISNRLKLLQAVPEVRQSLVEEIITAQDVIGIIRETHQTGEAQKRVLDRVTAKKKEPKTSEEKYVKSKESFTKLLPKLQLEDILDMLREYLDKEMFDSDITQHIEVALKKLTNVPKLS